MPDTIDYPKVWEKLGERLRRLARAYIATVGHPPDYVFFPPSLKFPVRECFEGGTTQLMRVPRTFAGSAFRLAMSNAYACDLVIDFADPAVDAFIEEIEAQARKDIDATPVQPDTAV